MGEVEGGEGRREMISIKCTYIISFVIKTTPMLWYYSSCTAGEIGSESQVLVQGHKVLNSTGGIRIKPSHIPAALVSCVLVGMTGHHSHS